MIWLACIVGAYLIGSVRDDASLGEPLVEGLPYLRAEAVFAARHEMATTVDDVLSHRTRARLLARDASADAAPAVAELIGAVHGWTTEEQEAQVEAYRGEIDAERAALDLEAAPAAEATKRPPGWTPGLR